MSWFQLDPESIANRTHDDVPSLSESVWRGIIGFTLVSVAGFAPWAIAGRWFYRNTGEAGLYAVCAVVFVGLSGLLMHRLIIGSGSMLRFYQIFTVAFAAYAVGWIVGWMSLKGHLGSVVGLLAGTLVMGWILAEAFAARDKLVVIVAALFLLNAAGYFVGGWVEARVASADGFLGLTKSSRVTLAKFLWGVLYGLGFGGGLGLAFHLCQNAARALIRSRSHSVASPSHLEKS
jgi:hypothetical protein